MSLSRFGARPDFKVVETQSSAPLRVPTPATTTADPKRMSLAERARTTLGTARSGAVSFAHADPHATEPLPPFTVMAAFAAAANGDLVLGLRQAVAAHVGNAERDVVSVAVGDSPLAAASVSGTGVTLHGMLRAVVDEEVYERVTADYLGAHNGDSAAVRRGEITLRHFRPERIRIITPSGFIEDVDLGSYRAATTDPLALIAPSLMTHVGQDSQLFVLLVRAFGGEPTAVHASLCGIDQYGVELVVSTDTGRRSARVNFSKLVQTPDDVRRELEALGRGARFKLGVG